ncbi:hypothetical protein GCK72_018534 [Caenorhabditis remanei]|uniref:Homeobox domain-containing protein n=1 Tax=Caenorhabditis remanei TaxID=31234 RepID=A0A6A5GAG3_CAERE|nr:hypothetical protein GCK72_018534 [Caenorhabditis remanei]KAF1751980.1 hypothetical protein GCK72_018534 [Caenorhabditis remanei]
MEVQESTSSPTNIPKAEDDKPQTPKRETRPTPIPQQRLDIWSRIRHGHVATAMKFRSLLLFISSTLVTFIETISEPKHDKIPPTEIIARIVTSFINGRVEQPQRFRGMHYHEVYLAISPMITSVNWARIKFDRKDAMRCYKSLANVLQVCFEQVGLANHAEADQLVLSIYVTSVWCSILKQHPELAPPVSDHQDFETYMKSWIFSPHLENFSKVFVASCCQIMESSDHIKQQQSTAERRHSVDSGTQEEPHPLPLTSMLPEISSRPDLITSPMIPSPSRIHPSWTMPPHPSFDPYLGYTSPIPTLFSPFPPTVIHPPIDPHQNYPHVPTPSTTDPVPPAPSIALPPLKPPRAPKRKQKLPTFQELASTVTKGGHKKGPKPGTKYRQRITNEASMILENEARRLAMNPPDRHSKRRISERTNISLYQVKSFFNRITAEQRRLRMGKPIKRHNSRRKLVPANT